jgi:hypothetical protein
LATILTNSWFFFLAAIFLASIVGYSNPHPFFRRKKLFTAATKEWEGLNRKFISCQDEQQK